MLGSFCGVFSFFRGLLQDLSLAVAPSCIHRTEPLRAFQTSLMGFLQRGEKLRGFLQLASRRWKLVSDGSVFKPLSVNVGFRHHLGALRPSYRGSCWVIKGTPVPPAPPVFCGSSSGRRLLHKP